MVKVKVRVPLRVLRYFRKKPGSVFIIAFQVLLLAAALFLIRGDHTLANEMAVYGYYSLVVGVVFQLAMLIRGEPEER